MSLLAAPVALAGAPPVAVASLVMSNIAAVGLPFVLPDGDEKEVITAVLQVSWGNRVFARASQVLKQEFSHFRTQRHMNMWGGGGSETFQAIRPIFVEDLIGQSQPRTYGET